MVWAAPLVLALLRLPVGPTGQRSAVAVGALVGGLHALLLLHWLPAAAEPLLGLPMAWGAALAVWVLNAAAVAVITAATHRLRTAGRIGRISVPPIPVPVTLAAGWVVLGWLPSSLPVVGFPWLGPEAALVEVPSLLAAAPWIGGAGVAGLLTFTGAALGQVMAARQMPQRPGDNPAGVGRGMGRRPPWRWLVLAVLPWAVVAGFLPNGRGADLKWADMDAGAAHRSGEGIRVAALSVEADPELLADPERRTRVLPERMEALMTLMEPGEVDFILWPESPTGTSEPPWEVDAALRWSRALGTPILFGALEGPERRNRLLQASPDSRLERLREKRRLVPMVESRAPGTERMSMLTFPLPERRWTGALADGVGEPVGEPVGEWVGEWVADGDEEQAAEADGVGDRVMAGALICFEALFGGEGRALRRAGARVLLLPSNEGWLAGTGAGWNDAARRQHRAAAVLRSVELAMPVVRSAVGGLAGAWDASGRGVPETVRTVAGSGSVALVEIRPAGRRVPVGSLGSAVGVALAALLLLLSGAASRILPVEAG
ncbi:MAG: hypothetical protein EA422_10800 [Gemmatimonadales bacterium]|nr:MAG: hypothetical protein EA422_10800 [Gemmatimonadales bacterium]